MLVSINIIPFYNWVLFGYGHNGIWKNRKNYEYLRISRHTINISFEVDKKFYNAVFQVFFLSLYG